MGFFDSLKPNLNKRLWGTPSFKDIWSWRSPSGSFLQRLNDPFFQMPQEPVRTTPAGDLSTDVTDSNALVELLKSTTLPTFLQQLREKGGGPTTEDMQTLVGYGNMLTGQATDAERSAFMEHALATQLFSQMTSGALDDPEALSSAVSSWAKQLSSVQGSLPATTTTTPEDQSIAQYMEQLRQDAEMKQMDFRRQGIEAVLSMIPSDQRFQAFATMAQSQPEIARLFFGDMIGSGGKAPGQELQETAKFLRSFT